ALDGFARAEAAEGAGRVRPAVAPFAALRRRLWAAEVRLSVGRAAAAVDDLEAASALLLRTGVVPAGPARAAVAAYLAERAEVAAWRADAARRAAGLASAGLAVPRPDRPRPARTTRAGPARDARGDATLAWPPVDAADGDDGVEAAALGTARRRTAAWWRGRRR
ncbi:MAG: hypothetical protein JNM10_00990, partial [Planctomycetia bacterium]|nr:hypothetical protein [Planctomycetia bacterium]